LGIPFTCPAIIVISSGSEWGLFTGVYCLIANSNGGLPAFIAWILSNKLARNDMVVVVKREFDMVDGLLGGLMG
jgi:uncharacterized membrane protein YdjX (TVP38/TMEM64 family)